MPPITRANERRRKGIQRWRCGTCLFELPDHLIPLPADEPFTEFTPNDSGDGVISHDITEAGLQSSAERGCKICLTLRSNLDMRSYPKAWWRRGYIRAWDSRSQIFVQDHSPISVYPLSFHPFVDSGDYPSGDTRSQEAFDKAASWIERCHREHRSCTKVSGERRMPKRLLFIDDFALLKVRLIENADKLPIQPYVCLSHRWLPETESSGLKKQQSEIFQKEIPREKFYPLLIDAVEATHRLGFQYLWIDCLCVYQDSRQDWHRQASDMSAIYANAVLTLSAVSCGPGAEQSLFSKAPTREAVEIGVYCGSKAFLRRSIPHPFVTDPYSATAYINPAADFPLVKRGWAYQEHLLSRGVLQFTKDEVIWECNEALWCECRMMEDEWRTVKSRSAAIPKRDWLDIVCEYFKTHLSIRSDRLPAIAGIAKHFGEARGWTYLAGLWQEDLMAGLMWVMNRGCAENRITPHELPSWSWASVTGSIFFNRPDDLLVKVISSEVILGPNPFGVPKFAELVLEGPCIPAALLHGPDVMNASDNDTLDSRLGDYAVSLKVDDSSLHVSCDYLFTEPGGDYIPSGTPAIFLATMHSGRRLLGLVLLPVDPLETRYERIGVASTTKPFVARKIQSEWGVKRFTFV